MKLISETQQAKIRFYYEIAASGILATMLVSVTAFLGSPLAYGLVDRISA